jgi:hypothetical protein
MSEYQRRLDAWARVVASESRPRWEPPSDATAEIRVDEGWAGTEVTGGYEGSLEVLLGGQWVGSFQIGDMSQVLAGLFSVELEGGAS